MAQRPRRRHPAQRSFLVPRDMLINVSLHPSPAPKWAWRICPGCGFISAAPEPGAVGLRRWGRLPLRQFLSPTSGETVRVSAPWAPPHLGESGAPANSWTTEAPLPLTEAFPPAGSAGAGTQGWRGGSLTSPAPWRMLHLSPWQSRDAVVEGGQWGEGRLGALAAPLDGAPHLCVREGGVQPREKALGLRTAAGAW